jgi:transcription elongation factor Elf1
MKFIFLSIRKQINPMAKTIRPVRLVMLQMGDNCMFCEQPTGPSFLWSVDITSKMGYIYCSNCKNSVHAAVHDWHANKAYGRVRYLKDREIQVKRSSGEIEGGWVIDSPFVEEGMDGQEVIRCYHKTNCLGRSCAVEDLIRLNPVNA